MGGFLSELISLSGAIGAAAVELTPVDIDARREFDERNARGDNGKMEYLKNNLALRFDPSALTDPQAKTLICVAFNSRFNETRDRSLPQFASYALGEDYHHVLRERVETALMPLKTARGGVWRVCIDSAPVMERYWAVKSGLATRCLNSMVAVRGYGQQVLLAEILTDIPLEELIGAGESRMIIADRVEPLTSPAYCISCNRCVEACPGKAITPGGDFIARRCVNYLTIERRGEWDEEERGVMDSLPEPGTLYGCDICRDVCPMNMNLTESGIEELRPAKRLLEITADEILTMGSGEFKRIFGRSASFRTGLATLKRNARQTKKRAGKR